MNYLNSRFLRNTVIKTVLSKGLAYLSYDYRLSCLGLSLTLLRVHKGKFSQMSYEIVWVSSILKICLFPNMPTGKIFHKEHLLKG